MRVKRGGDGLVDALGRPIRVQKVHPIDVVVRNAAALADLPDIMTELDAWWASVVSAAVPPTQGQVVAERVTRVMAEAQQHVRAIIEEAVVGRETEAGNRAAIDAAQAGLPGGAMLDPEAIRARLRDEPEEQIPTGGAILAGPGSV